MKAQDRSAIKEIMASKNKAKAQESESPPTAAALEATALAAAAAAAAAISSADSGTSSVDGSALPYGGDLQAAMKAQDRGAIKQVMASRNASKERDRDIAPPFPNPRCPTAVWSICITKDSKRIGANSLTPGQSPFLKSL